MPATLEANSKPTQLALNRPAVQDSVRLTAISRLEVPRDAVRVRSPRDIAIGSTDSSLTSSPLAAGCPLCEASLKALEEKKLEVKVEKVLKLNESSSVAVFRIYASPDGKESRPVGPPIVVPGLGTADYAQNKMEQISKMLDLQASYPPKSITPESGAPVLIDAAQQPALWSAIDSGQRIVQGKTRDGYNGSKIETIHLEDGSGQRSGPIYLKQGDAASAQRAVELLAQGANVPGRDSTPAASVQLSSPIVAMGNNWSAVLQGDLQDYYCEHMAYSVQREAEYAPDCSILRNASNEPLCGFIHVPRDQYSSSEKTQKSAQLLAQRHRETSEVVASAMRGYYEDARAALPADEPMRILLTGYDRFSGARDNQTGEFAENAQIVGRALSSAFTLADETKISVQTIRSAPPTIKLSAQIVDPTSGEPKGIEVVGVNFPVNDAAISGKQGSVQSLIRDQKPHAVISMGSSTPTIAQGKHRIYQLSSRCDDARLSRDGTGAQQRALDAAKVSLPENRSLARAIYRGSVIREEGKK